jgi:predicted AAA+ superfamily ATPase
MVKQAAIEQVAQDQRSKIDSESKGIKREALPFLPELERHALIVTGIRRCGKSTLLLQLLESKHKNAFYLNFEDPRLFGFELPDFQLLDSVIGSKKRMLFFDEIQVIEGWERYVRQKLDAGFRICVTGSNASLLSRELGTKLTGRHVSKELFPFSYKEFLLFKKLKAGVQSWRKYAEMGGFPEYLKTKDTLVLADLFTDILQRDIAVRHGIRDVRSLERLAVYLVSNAGTLVSAGKLRPLVNIQASSTILEYFSFLEDSYLFGFVPKFGYSLKVQLANPRKVYCIDPGIVKIASQSLVPDWGGHLLENMVYLHLRRQGKSVSYYQDRQHECDFVVSERNKPECVVQVCHTLSPENLKREQDGLHAAMQSLGVKQGLILTHNQHDAYIWEGKKIEVMPVWEWMVC